MYRLVLRWLRAGSDGVSTPVLTQATEVVNISPYMLWTTGVKNGIIEFDAENSSLL
jgi:hypothetical protein